MGSISLTNLLHIPPALSFFSLFVSSHFRAQSIEDGYDLVRSVASSLHRNFEWLLHDPPVAVMKGTVAVTNVVI